MEIDQAALHRLMRRVGREQLVPRFARLAGSLKADGSLLTEADLAAQQALAKALLRLCPGSVVLGEEMSASEQAHGLVAGRPLWCLDPLDGTRNFSAGIPYFSISIALLEEGQVTLAAVYDPLRDELFHADRSSGALLNGAALQSRSEPQALQQSIALVDFKRLPTDLAMRLVSAPPYQSQRSFGSVALDWCWLADRRVQVYLHGRAHLWDYVAGQFIFQRSGGLSSTLEGEPVFRPALVARSCVGAVTPALFEEWRHYLNIPDTQPESL